MAHKHSVYDTDPHFSINTATRAIKNESTTKTCVIQYDHNSERFTFEIPRFVDGHDMSLCNVIQIHYLNVDSSTKAQNSGVYEAQDMQIIKDTDGEFVVFSWLISQNATLLVGSLHFLVRFCCASDDGTVDYVWNTGIHTGISVSAGMNSGTEIVEEYADIIEQWRVALFETGDSAVTSVNDAKNDALSEIAEASTSFGNAIKGTASGKIVRIDDVSPLTHKAKVKVSGKNIIKPFTEAFTHTKEEMTQSCEAGGQTITLNGVGCSTGGGRNNFKDVAGLFTVEKGKTYTLSHKLVSGTCGGIYTVYISAKEGHDAIASCANMNASKTFVSDYSGECYVGINIVSGATYDNAVVCFQLEEGDTATEYEPYIDPTTATVTRCGKNLFKITSAKNHSEFEGVEFAITEDGGVSLNGTVTGNYLNINLNTMYLPIGSYVATTTLENTYPTIFVEHADGTQTNFSMADKVVIPFEIKEGDKLAYVQIRSKIDISFAGVCYFQIEEGSTATEYEAYNGITHILSEEGTVDVDSLSPTMTILTDTNGMNIEVEYNRDTDIFVSEAVEKAEEAAKKAEEAAERASESADSNLPTVTEADNGKVLAVEGGAWAAVTVTDAEGVSV